jgi:thiol-disulfide isomerase/thioredoxin
MAARICLQTLVLIVGQPVLGRPEVVPPNQAPRPCGDDDEGCMNWAAAGECDANPLFMRQTCRKSCGVPPCPRVVLPKKEDYPMNLESMERAQLSPADQAPQPCGDDDEGCASWAANGECDVNTAFMHHRCRKSCGVAPCPRVALPKKEAWELENLEREYPDTVFTDLDGNGLAAFANRVETPVFTWFYAPWCKQCKLVRPDLEVAAKRYTDSSAPPLAFAKLDCVKDPEAKAFYGVNSYPSFKVLRGRRHKWVELIPAPRLPDGQLNRSAEVMLATAAREARGPVHWLSTEDELRTALFKQVPAGVNARDSVGLGEALAIAVLSSTTGAAAIAYANLAAGCSTKLSPLPFVATTNSSIVTAVGLERIPMDHVAIVALFSEPSGAPEEEQMVPRLATRPLLPPGADALDLKAEEAMCMWALGHRVPILIDADEDPYWSDRAGALSFNKMTAILFLSPPHAHLAGVVRAAAARFDRGTIIVMTFMASSMSISDVSNAMFKRYGVKSIFDTPRLVVLDKRIELKGANPSRQRHYKGTLTEDAIVEFIKSPDARLSPDTPPIKERSRLKDEL